MTQEEYIEHEVKLRLHGEFHKKHDENFRELRDSIKHLENKIDNKIDSSIKHLDNKMMIIFGIILGSIWLPAILHYLHVT